MVVPPTDPTHPLVPTPSPDPLAARALLDVRAALVFLGALVIGVVAGALSYLSQPDLAAACLVSCGGVAAATMFLNSVIGRA